MSNNADIDWDAYSVNMRPYTDCVVCKGTVEPLSYVPLMKVCTACDKTWMIYLPLPFALSAHNEADALAFGLYEDGLSWGAVAIVMATRHNVQLGADVWRVRIKKRYPLRRG